MELTKKMEQCLMAMEPNGLIVFPGGKWARENTPLDINGHPKVNFGHQTIYQLVDAGMAEFTAWDIFERRKMPVEVGGK